MADNSAELTVRLPCDWANVKHKRCNNYDVPYDVVIIYTWH